MLVMLAAFQFFEKQRHETGELLMKTRYDEEAVEKFIYWYFFVYFSFHVFQKRNILDVNVRFLPTKN